ncbi:proline-rich protein HaeIII subfamily 1-like [Oryctolagus cuniculus]|uniref:proline-rich protein HaeIII subfamily 1-like n=1 Tax=Oryctolagus cuniculus TaxID=9986 RepID=UPI00387996A1
MLTGGLPEDGGSSAIGSPRGQAVGDNDEVCVLGGGGLRGLGQGELPTGARLREEDKGRKSRGQGASHAGAEPARPKPTSARTRARRRGNPPAPRAIWGLPQRPARAAGTAAGPAPPGPSSHGPRRPANRQPRREGAPGPQEPVAPAPQPPPTTIRTRVPPRGPDSRWAQEPPLPPPPPPLPVRRGGAETRGEARPPDRPRTPGPRLPTAGPHPQSPGGPPKPPVSSLQSPGQSPESPGNTPNPDLPPGLLDHAPRPPPTRTPPDRAARTAPNPERPRTPRPLLPTAEPHPQSLDGTPGPSDPRSRLGPAQSKTPPPPAARSPPPVVPVDVLGFGAGGPNWRALGVPLHGGLLAEPMRKGLETQMEAGAERGPLRRHPHTDHHPRAPSCPRGARPWGALVRGASWRPDQEIQIRTGTLLPV